MLITSSRRPYQDRSADLLEVARRKALEDARPGDTVDDFMASMTRHIDAETDRRIHSDVQKMQEAPYRINTAVMTGLSSVARAAHPLGGLLGVATGVPLAGVGLFELHTGFQADDQRMKLDGLFNVATGAALVAGAFQGGALGLAAPALVVAKEAYLAVSRPE